MHPKFAEVANSLHPSFERLTSMRPVTIDTCPKDMPRRGVYLFSEGSKHLYVGRSNRMHQRPGRHCANTHRAAAFAFLLAREKTGFTKRSYKTGPESRDGLMKNPVFLAAFSEARARIRKMKLRYVEETDPTRQAMLEIYCAVVLNAKYNDFDNH
jgi:hypothetical protein